MKRAAFIALGLFVAALGVMVLVRRATFDPQAFAAEAHRRVRPVEDVMAALASPANGAPAGAAAAAAARLEQSKRALVELRRRYHAGEGRCARYGGDEEGDVDGAADAIVLAGLDRQLDAMIREARSAATERDDRIHRAGEAEEVVDWFGEQSSWWTRLALAIRRRDAYDAYRAVATHPLPAARLLSPDHRDAARAIEARYGLGAMIAASLRIARRRR